MADAYNTSTSTTEFSPALTSLAAQDAFNDATQNALSQLAFDLTPELVAAASIEQPIHPQVDLADETEGTPLEYKQFSSSSWTLTLNTKKAVVIPLYDYAHAVSNQNLMDGYARQGARDAARKVDISLAGLYASATLTVTAGTGADIDEADVLAAKEALDGANAPATGRWLALHHTQYNALLSIDRFTRIDSLGVTAIPTGVVGMLHGFTVYLDQNIVATTDGFRQNMFGVSNGRTESSIVKGMGTFRPLTANFLAVGNAPRLVWGYDMKIGSEVLRVQIFYGVAGARTEWLGVIKTQDT